ncbi:ABC transporter permease [Pseudomonas sp. GX19020]|uniref:ABC transporter permease n=1 Tax=Pseudomonadota TaxID=1224 RepID=UPI000899711B|nr:MULTISPECIES: ABC transporter permease [Pseudomonadota]MCL4067920.1 ABC transporter permease [Pseudomonas sp. GX19020]SED77836.1 peptide/nickel transport system permease protein [Rhodobacter sp. 24-YEA-8]
MSVTTLDPAARVAAAQTVSSRIWREAFASIEFRIGLMVFVLLVLAAALYPELSGLDPTKLSVREKLIPPLFLGEGWTWKHPLGTDQLGRDMLSRSLTGLRYSLLIGVATTVLMLIVGALIGLFAGYYGGRVDMVLMRLTDAQLAIPMIILAITILGVSRPTIPSIILVLGLAGWPVYARVMRSTVMAEAKKEYVRGAMVLGATNLRIMFLLILPLLLPPMAFVAVLDIARMMIFESVLGFIGLGVQPPTPTFGNIISDGRKYIMNAWWIATMPGVFLVITLTSINLMGAALERARNKIYGGA